MKLTQFSPLLAGFALLAGCSANKEKGGETASGKGSPTPRNTLGAEVPKNPILEPGAGTNPANPAPPTVRDEKGIERVPGMPRVPTPNPAAFEIVKSGQGNWKPAAIQPAVLASKVAAAFQGLKGTYAEALTTIKTPVGNGQTKNQIKVQDPKNYCIQYLFVDEMPGNRELRADGSKRTSTSTNGRYLAAKPLETVSSDAGLNQKQLMEKWPTEFPRLAFRGLVDGKDPWQPLFSALFSPTSEFKTEITQRTLKYQGRDITNYRVTARRNPVAAKKRGSCEFEMVFDGTRFLPVTIRVNRTESQKNWNILWQTGWFFKRNFNPKEFQIPNGQT